MFEGQIASIAGKQMFPEKELFKIVHTHAKWGALAIALPFLPFIDDIIYVVVLWHMYSALAECAKKNVDIGLGIFVNIMVCLGVMAVDSVLEWTVIGGIIPAFIVYIQFYLSGKAYISILRG